MKVEKSLRAKVCATNESVHKKKQNNSRKIRKIFARIKLTSIFISVHITSSTRKRLLSRCTRVSVQLCIFSVLKIIYQCVHIQLQRKQQKLPLLSHTHTHSDTHPATLTHTFSPETPNALKPSHALSVTLYFFRPVRQGRPHFGITKQKKIELHQQKNQANLDKCFDGDSQ